MAASDVQNPAVQAESKSQKKKKAKAAAAAVERTESPAPTASPAGEKATDAGDDASESPYVRELQKNIRNINKKISNMAKTEAVITENPGKSLEQLLAAKLINADQKAQISKKPALLAQLTQNEEQIAQFKKLDSEYRAKAQQDKAVHEKEKAELKTYYTEQIEKEVAAAVEAAKKSTKGDVDTAVFEHLKEVSGFLRLAAARREDPAGQSEDAGRAIEGVLGNMYVGDDDAAGSMIALVRGSNERTFDVDGTFLDVTFADLRTWARAYMKEAPQVRRAPETEHLETEGDAQPAAAPAPGTDLTVANASLTEITAGDDAALVNGSASENAQTPVASNADASNEAANAAGDKWDTGNDLGASAISQEWVNIPRDPAETETGLEATPANASNTQSWADDQPEQPVQPAVSADPNDGFRQVPGRNRGNGNREGGSGFRGGRGRGDFRGGRGGFRGEGRGRGRGQRGGSSSTRGGPRRNEES
ncbi:hypothetical protein D7B24_002143 [Verticillium nonalfalfae]|uniref:YAG7-like dimerisation domain-containing protein n=1 Tax=Verticillium nonalfalfae TaxID=1051616 RepID=A0A3M9YGM1_9PEZI|nr:uncharacterized protein D7B24_002143 [Verticillium nonalfalfae]RNJ59534.1 hypothetical protein D7B24_002143 [Verticillium nonalfalfae]